MRNLFIKFLLSIISITSFANEHIQVTKVEYGETEKFEGYFVGKKSSKSAPSILMIHNWMGVSDETLTQAKRFANLGYNVFVADIYGKGIRPANPAEAGGFSGKYKTDRKLFRERLNLGLETMKKQKHVDSKKLIAMGYCFGGTGAIELARSGADIIGAVSFHGGLDSPTPADGKNIKAKLLINHGAIDPFVKAEDIVAFEKELNSNNIDYQFIKYANAVHSFTDKSAGNDNSKGAAYNKKADDRSFQATVNFLKEISE